MNIRYIALDIDYPIYSRINEEFGAYFGYRARFIDNFLSKIVRKDKIPSDKFKMISINLHVGRETCVKLLDYLQVFQVFLRVEEKELDDFLLMDEIHKYEYFLQLHERGYREANKYFDIGIEKLLSYNDILRQNGFKNEWLFKKKQIKEYGIYIFLDCSFTSFDFNLYMSVYDLKKIKLIARKSIFHTKPDEFFYQEDLRKVFFDDEKMQIIDFLDHPICEYYYKDLAEGIIKVNFLDEDLIKHQFTDEEQGKYHWKPGRSIAMKLNEV
ncbi:MAG: hypothetical protein IJK21_07140 [Prevotella sp.]|nr:hypothetical protein [Prevotella sp.]